MIEMVDSSKLSDLLNLKENKGVSFPYFFYEFIHNDFILIYRNNNKIWGTAQFGKNPNKENILWLKFISVLPEFKQKE